MTLQEYIKNHITENLCIDIPTLQKFQERLQSNTLTKADNSQSHFCCHFVPMDQNEHVFIGHHKKAGTWIFPGGHIDKGELPEETVVREMEEELFISVTKEQVRGPFFFSLVNIDNQKQVCKEHYDMWFLVQIQGKIDKSKFLTDEFYDGKWVSLSEARTIITKKNNLEALERIEN